VGPSGTLLTAYEITWCLQLEPRDYELVVYFHKMSISEYVASMVRKIVKCEL